MPKLTGLMYIIVAPLLVVAFWVAVLSTSVTMASKQAMFGALIAGLVLGLPAAWIVAKMLVANQQKGAQG